MDNLFQEVKILHIIDCLGLGGAQTVVKGIFEHQNKNKNIFLFALREKDVLINIDHPNIMNFNSKRKYSIRPLFKIRDLIKKENITILHCHLFRSQVFGYFLKIIWFKDLKLIFHEHGDIIKNHVIYNLFLRFSMSKVNIILAVSKATKNSLIKNAKIDYDKIRLLYNFVDLNKFNRELLDKINKEQERTGYNFKKEDFIIGCAGRLIKRKGWKDFVEVAKSVISDTRFSNIKFLIGGDGKDRDELINFIKENNLESKINYIGYISNMLYFYAILDCFCMPSYWEGLPMAQLEALSLGIPLVTSNGPGVNEIAKEDQTCLYFKVGDQKKLKENILRLYLDKNLQQRLTINSTALAQNFSLENYVSQLNKIYEKIIIYN